MLYLLWRSSFTKFSLTCKCRIACGCWYISCSTSVFTELTWNCCCWDWSFKAGFPRLLVSQICVSELRWKQLTRIEPESFTCSAFSSDKSLDQKIIECKMSFTEFKPWWKAVSQINHQCALAVQYKNIAEKIPNYFQGIYRRRECHLPNNFNVKTL